MLHNFKVEKVQPNSNLSIAFNLLTTQRSSGISQSQTSKIFVFLFLATVNTDHRRHFFFRMCVLNSAIRINHSCTGKRREWQFRRDFPRFIPELSL